MIPRRSSETDGPSRDGPWGARGALIFASAWLLALLALDLALGGAIRWALVFAVPVVLVAMHDLQLGLVAATASTLVAVLGGAIPSEGSVDGGGWEVVFALSKLTVVAITVRYAVILRARRSR